MSGDPNQANQVNPDEDEAAQAAAKERHLAARRASLEKARATYREQQAAAREAPERTASAEALRSHFAPPRDDPGRPDASTAERGERAEPAREETLGIEIDSRRLERDFSHLTRRSRFDRDVDGIYFPERLKKRGWDYQFVTVRVMNQDQGRVDESELRSWEDQGWRPCLAGDYPDLAARGAPKDQPIEMRGSRAYERPKHLSEEAKEEDRIYAEEQRIDRTRAAATGGLGDGIPRDRRGLVSVPEGVRVEGGMWQKGG
jgi:hypothetical protein